MTSTLRRFALLSTAAALLVAAAPAAAQYASYSLPPPPSRGQLGGALRIGVDTPSGSLYSGEGIRDQFGRQLSVSGELGVRITPQFLLGGYLGAGFGDAGPRFDAACYGSHCGAWSARIGFLAQYDFAPWSTVSPWIGYGVGFTAASTSGDAPGARFEYSYAGIDVARLSAGLDFRPNRTVGMGLYAEWTFGVYRAYHWSEEGLTVAEGSVSDPTVHQWFSIGPRITF